MQKLISALLLTTALASCAPAQEADHCAAFQALVKATYNFKPAKLTATERDAKSTAMDKVWDTVQANPTELTPCLRRMLQEPGADPFFLFDGSTLLVKVDPSPASKSLLISNYSVVDLDDVDLRVWASTLSRLGLEGFDVSAAGDHWLRYPRAHYFLPEHGAYEVKKFAGALFIFGSMDEAQATPALVKIVNEAEHPGREFALRLLFTQATPESLHALQQLNITGLSDKARADIRATLEHPHLFTPRAKPKTTRAEFLKAFHGVEQGQMEDFFTLTERVPDGEKDVVAVMLPEDLPLLRRVRRIFIANGNPHVIEFYNSFTDILMTLVWKQGLTKSNPSL